MTTPHASPNPGLDCAHCGRDILPGTPCAFHEETGERACLGCVRPLARVFVDEATEEQVMGQFGWERSVA